MSTGSSPRPADGPRVRPGWVSTVVVLFVCTVTIRLGFWQLSRYRERSAIAEQRESRHALPELTTVEPPYDALDYRRVRLTGHYRNTHVVTGGIKFSRNGYAVVSTLDVDDGPDVLVLRGWIPVDGWTAWLDTDPGPVVVEGILQVATDTAKVEPLVHPTLGKPYWPLQTEPFLGVLTRGVLIPIHSIAAVESVTGEVYVVQGPELEDLEQRRTTELPAGGYTTYLKVLHHLEYAVQWFSFSLIAFGLWLWYGWRRARQTEAG
ncbi:MAG: SURF1 family protein [Myxococcota bacterium]